MTTTSHNYAAALATAVAKANVPPAHLAAAKQLSFDTFLQVLLALMPILSNSLPVIFSTINDIVTALKAGNFTWATFSALLAKDEPAVVAVIQAIAAALGIIIPAPTPVVPS